MTRIINLTTDVREDRKVNIILPSDVPIGPAEIRIRVTTREPRLRTLGDLAQSEFFGMWRHRKDIRDSVTFARRLRKKAWKRN